MLRVLHDRTHTRKSEDFGVKRFQIRKPGRYSRLAVSVSADAGSWSRAGTLDLVAAVDASRLEVIARSVAIPLNQEPILIDLPGGQEIRYFAFDPWRSRRAGFARIRLKIWAEDYRQEIP